MEITVSEDGESLYEAYPIFSKLVSANDTSHDPRPNHELGRKYTDKRTYFAKTKFGH